MSGARTAPGDNRQDTHAAAVRRTLGWADDAARAGDHRLALEWLAVIEAIGDPLPEPYQIKRNGWREAAGGTCREASHGRGMTQAARDETRGWAKSA